MMIRNLLYKSYFLYYKYTVILTRTILPLVRDGLRRRRVVAIIGPRQVGKTTLLRLVDPSRSRSGSSILCMDDPDLRLRLLANPVGELKKFGRKLIILDELQKAPALFDTIKLLADEPEGPSFLVTGSAQLQLLPKVRESLAGRIRLIDLWPFSLREQVGRGDVECGLDRLWKSISKEAYDAFPAEVQRDINLERRWRTAALDAQLVGGFPPLIESANAEKPWEWLADYRRTYLERDLADIGRPSDLDQFARAQRCFAARSGGILEMSSLSQDLGVSLPTIRRWLRFLEISYQALLVEPVGSAKVRMVARPKLIWGDVGLGRLLAENRNPDDGAWYENWVLLELEKWRSAQSDPPSLRYLRTSHGLEIDAVLHGSDNRILLLEVKMAKVARPTWATPMMRAREILNDPNAFGVVCYRGRTIEKLARRIWAVPDYLLLV